MAVKEGNRKNSSRLKVSSVGELTISIGGFIHEMGSACAKKDLRAPPRGYTNRWSGTEVGLAHLRAPNLPIIVRLASLILSNRKETPIREPAISCQR